MAVDRALLAEVFAEHFGTYIAEYRPARRQRPVGGPDDPPEAVATRRAAINLADHDEHKTLEAEAA